MNSLRSKEIQHSSQKATNKELRLKRSLYQETQTSRKEAGIRKKKNLPRWNLVEQLACLGNSAEFVNVLDGFIRGSQKKMNFGD